MDIEHIGISKEEMEAFMELGALSLQYEWTYVPSQFRAKKTVVNEAGEESEAYVIPMKLWPQWTLTVMSGGEAAALEDEMRKLTKVNAQSGEISMGDRPGSSRIELLRRHIKGWKNWRDDRGVEIPFVPKEHVKTDGLISSEIINRIPLHIQRDLEIAIQNRLYLSEEELRGLESLQG